jgi:uncharacterized protein
MILKLDEIPPEGRNVSFELDKATFNERLSLTKSLVDTSTQLLVAPTANILAEISNITVVLKGKAKLSAESICSRCSETAEINLETKVSMVLKPKRSKEDEVEDLDLGFYEGKEIDLAPIVEENLILNLPYKVLCKPDCLGLCIKCGENLNFGPCRCQNKAEVKGKEEGTEQDVFRPFAGLSSKIKN